MSRRESPDIARRRLIAAAAAAGIGSLLGRRVAAAGSADLTALPLITKAIPATGERLPAIGTGTDDFRESAREEIRAELGKMIELGGTVIDTAASYGDSEA